MSGTTKTRGKRPSKGEQKALDLLRQIGKAVVDKGDQANKSVGKSTRKARPKPIVSPKLIPPVTPRPQRAKPNTPASRRETREAYLKAPPSVRKVVRDQQSTQGDTARKQSRDINRAEQYVREATKVAKAGRLPKGTGVEERERILKGLRILDGRQKRDELRAALAVPGAARLERVVPKESSAGVGGSLGSIIGNIAGGLAGSQHRGSQGDAVAQGVRKELEGKFGPLDNAQKAALKGTVDATGEVLHQLLRTSSASAGFADAITSGRPDKALQEGVKGFVKNDRSWERVARKAGLDGLDAEVLGLIGDIGFDPLTYLTLGTSASLRASERTVREAAQRTLNKQVKDIDRRLKRGSIDDARHAVLIREAVDAQVTRIDAKLAKPRAKADKARQRYGEQPRGLQVGLRGPGFRGQVNVGGGRVTAALRDATRKAQQSPAANQVTTSLSTKTPAIGVSKAEHEILARGDRVSRASGTQVLNRAERVAKYLKRYSNAELATIREAIEAGSVAELSPRLRPGAERVGAFLEDARVRLSAAVGKEVQLDTRMLAEGDLRKLAKSTSDFLKQIGDPATAKAARQAARGATDAASERAAVAMLRDAVGDTQKLANVRTSTIIGQARKANSKTARKYPELHAALNAETHHAAQAKLAREAGDTTKAALHEGERQAARAIVAQHHQRIRKALVKKLEQDGSAGLGGKLSRLLDDVERAGARAEEQVAKNAPKGYVPRDFEDELLAFFGDKQAIERVGQSTSGGRTSAERSRVAHREQIREMPPEVAERYSANLPLIIAKYGVQSAHRIYRAGVLQQAYKAFGMRVTPETIETLGKDIAIYRRSGTGIPQALDRPATLKAIDDANAGKLADDLFAIPGPISRDLHAIQNTTDPTRIGRAFRSGLRKWKEFNTIWRPGFFANNVASNPWQMFLADATLMESTVGQVRNLARLKVGEITERKGSTHFTRMLDRIGANRTYMVGGKRMTTADLLIEGAEVGALRTGSRLGHQLDYDLDPAQQAARQIAGVRNPVKATSAKAGNLAEDIDDAARATLYLRARTKLGMETEEATRYVYSVMIDYGALTEFERRVMKSIMPFYVFTSRNLPIQVRKLLQRPGKVANLEKVIEQMADSSDLPEGWEQMLSETDQERMLVPVPGLTVDGRQMFRDLRLPVSDLRRPAQAFDGVEGLKRLAQMYGADLGPYARSPLELIFNKRLDFDAPIHGDEARPAEAGTAITALEKLFGWNSDKSIVDRRTGKKYNPTNNAVSYLLRQLGSYPSLALGVGTESADRTGRTFPIRLADSLVGQGSVIPDVRETFLYGSVAKELDELYSERDGLKGQGREGTADYYRLQDRIKQAEALRGMLQVASGVAGPAGKGARRHVRDWQNLKIDPADPPEIRALEAEMRKIREELELDVVG